MTIRHFITAQANQPDASDQAFENLERAIDGLKSTVDAIPDQVAKALEPLAASVAMSQKAAGVTTNAGSRYRLPAGDGAIRTSLASAPARNFRLPKAD